MKKISRRAKKSSSAVYTDREKAYRTRGAIMKAQGERWASKSGEVTVTKVDKCPSCLSWNFPNHTCRT